MAGNQKGGSLKMRPTNKPVPKLGYFSNWAVDWLCRFISLLKSVLMLFILSLSTMMGCQARCSCCPVAHSPIPPTCSPGGVETLAHTGRATAGLLHLRVCLDSSVSSELVHSLNPQRTPQSSTTHMSPCCPCSWDPVSECGGDAIYGAHYMLRCNGVWFLDTFFTWLQIECMRIIKIQWKLFVVFLKKIITFWGN